MGEMGYVYGDPSSTKSQVELSAFMMGMLEKDWVALVRFVNTGPSKPLRVGALIPKVGINGEQYCIFAQVCVFLKAVGSPY